MLRHLQLAPTLLFLVSVAAAAGCNKDAAKGGDKTDADKPAQTADADTKDADTKEAEPAWEWTLPKGLKAPEVPADNPMSAAKVALGHKLFFDKRLSGDGSRSCYSCHQNQLGNADGRAKALGAGDKELGRNTPTIWNVAYHPALYWDGRAPSLEKQMIGAWKGGNMGAGDGVEAKAKEIGGLDEYKADFRAVFGLAEGDEVRPEHVAQAISAYERTLLCGDTPWDNNALEGDAKAGWELFRGKAACATCHAGPSFSDGLFHNVGIAVADGGDIGHGKVSGAEADNFKFRTPTLRGVGETAPYFHDGSVSDLREAVKYMASGGDRKVEGLDENFADRGLSDAEVDQLVAFLQTLKCPNNLEVIGEQSVPGIDAPTG
jgi:cytochrome c peroxidase